MESNPENKSLFQEFQRLAAIEVDFLIMIVFLYMIDVVGKVMFKNIFVKALYYFLFLNAFLLDNTFFNEGI